MKLKETFLNIYHNIKKGLVEHKRITVVTMSIIAGLILVGVLASLIDTHRKQKRMAEVEYSDALKSYNESVANYNSIAKEYIALLSGFERREIKIDNKEEPKVKEEMSYDFEAFYANNVDISSLQDLADALDLDAGELKKTYEKIEMDKYNEVVCQTNQEVERYNTLIKRLENYESISVSESKVNKDIVNQVDPTWIKAETYFADYDDISSESYSIQSDYYRLCLEAYNDIITDYNILAKAYNEAVEAVAIDFISSLPKKAELKDEHTDSEIKAMSEDALCESIEKNSGDIESLGESYLVVKQIKDPSDSFVRERLTKIADITGIATVTTNNDPNNLLGKEGGYDSCTYFTIKGIDSSVIKGNGIIGKGTDAGGAVEVYKSVKDALNRCDYLGQFDGTLLYSGSYAIIGTMVIRTSYKLNNKQQVDLTDRITRSLTTLE